MLTAAYQTQLIAENYGAALLDHDIDLGDPEWHPSQITLIYQALNRPQEEWRRLSQWENEEETKE